LLLSLLLVVAFGSLGVFPAYYSFSQELTDRHQGKLTGVLSFACWVAMAGWQEGIGRIVEATQSYTFCLILAGLLPLGGLLVLAALWGPTGANPQAPGDEESLPAVAVASSAIRPAGGVEGFERGI
jgi:hypothetical protein